MDFTIKQNYLFAHSRLNSLENHQKSDHLKIERKTIWKSYLSQAS